MFARPVPDQRPGQVQCRAEHAVGLGLRELPELVPRRLVFTITTLSTMRPTARFRRIAGSVLECRTGSPVHVWGQLDYQTRKADGDIEAGDNRSKRFTGLIGIDSSNRRRRDPRGRGRATSPTASTTASSATTPRETAGRSELRRLRSGRVLPEGRDHLQLAERRFIRMSTLAGLATGAPLAADPRQSRRHDVDRQGFMEEPRLAVGGESVLTPYVDYDYVHAKLGGFDRRRAQRRQSDVNGGQVRPQLRDRRRQMVGASGRRDPRAEPWLSLSLRKRIVRQFNAQFTTERGDRLHVRHRIGGAEEGHFLAGLSIGGKAGPVDFASATRASSTAT